MNLCHLFSNRALLQRPLKFKMESDCRLRCKPKDIILKFIIVCLISVHVTLGVFIDCDPVIKAKKCFCQKEPDGYEIQCPVGIRESYPISLKVKPSDAAGKTDEAVLKITCVPNDANFPYDLVGGLDLGKEDQGFVIAMLDIMFCSPLSITDGFREFFKTININGSAIRNLKFASYNTTVSLPQNFFNELTNLENVELPNNQLQTFPNLNILTKLKRLNFQNNKLVSVPRDAFTNNKNLSVILLDHNKLTKIEKSAFPDTTKSVDISYNEISTLTYESFANLKNLKRLYLDGNPMDNLEANTFTELPQLTELSLKYVNLKEFPTFKNLPKLKSLRISGPHNANKLPYNYNDERATTTYFPELEGVATTVSPEGEIVLDVVVKNLPELSELAFYNLGLTNFPVLDNLPNLTKLELGRNKLQTIPDRYLAKFPNLVTLDLSRNFISILKPLGNFNINDLNLEYNQISYLQEKFFQQLSHLKILRLSYNKIEYFGSNIFEPLGELEELYLKKNNISFNIPPKYTIVSNPGNNQSSDMEASQLFTTLAQIGMNASPLNKCFKLKKIDLSHNRIDKIYEDWRYVMGELRDLDLKYNNLTTLNWNDLSFTSGKIMVDLQHNRISTINMEGAMIFLKADGETGNDGDIEFKLDANPLHCDCLAYFLKTFKIKPYNLVVDKLECQTPLDLKGQKLMKVPDKKFVCALEDNECPQNCACWRRPFDETIVIDGSSRNFSSTDLPDVTDESILRLLKPYINNNRWKLKLVLSGNGLTELGNPYVSSLSSHLSMVDLTNNKLTKLNFLDAVTNNITDFLVADNPFSCKDCSGFQNIWRIYDSRLDVDNMTCIAFAGDKQTQQKLSGDQEELADICPILFSSELQGLVIAVGIFLAFLIIFVAVYIRHGWAIRAFLYSKGLGCCLCCDDMDDDEDKTYDAFVSYSHKDEDWVLNELVNRLEERDGFKLCVHIRDWTPGDWIPEQIVRSVDQSRRTVIVLSKNFVESIWSRLEFKTAHSQALNDKTNRLILILMGEDLTDDDVKDEDLRLYMKMNTYLKWNDPWFWHKLKYALPHRKNVMEENRNIVQKREQRERAIQLDKLRAKYEQNV